MIKSLGIFCCIAFMLRSSVVQAYRIPSSSMEPTLQVNDHILVNKLSYGIRLPFKAETIVDFRMPKRGDVVVFTRPDNPNTPEDESETNIIKRAVGLPGDIVQVSGTKVIINGKEWIDDDFHAVWVDGGKGDFGPATVPEDSLLLLGDNRDKSQDSRSWPGSPFLSIDRIQGRAFIIYWHTPDPLERLFQLIR